MATNAKLKNNMVYIYGFIELLLIFNLLKSNSIKLKIIRCQKARIYLFTN